MDKRLREIYNYMMQDREEDDVSRELKREVLNLVKTQKGKLPESDYAGICDIAFAIAGAGEEAGFVRGVRYAFELFLELIET